jgi:hypothetical protein
MMYRAMNDRVLEGLAMILGIGIVLRWVYELLRPMFWLLAIVSIVILLYQVWKHFWGRRW